MDVDVKLHKGQMLVFTDPHRFRVTVNGRRWGKTALGVTELFIAGLGYPGTVNPQFPIYVLGLLPTANQARAILWRPLYALATGVYKTLVTNINVTAMEITLYNGIIIRIAGANDNNGDRCRGLKVYFALFDEMQDIRRAVFYEVVRPAMSDTKGSRALFTGTPKGKQNVLYELANQEGGEWTFFNRPTWDNPIIPKKEIELAKATMPPRLFAQEYEASFVDFPGKLYSELCQENVYYGDVPKLDLVVAGIDFGDLHPCISVLGRAGRTWYYLEGWSPNRNPIEAQPVPDPLFHSNIRRLVKKWAIKATYCDPSRPSAILAIRDLGDEPGYRNAVAGYNPIQEGIAQVHSLIAQRNLLFTSGYHDKGKDNLDGLEAYELHQAYHRLTNKDGHFTDVPADGYFSHCCDSTRYALAVKKGSL